MDDDYAVPIRRGLGGFLDRVAIRVGPCMPQSYADRRSHFGLPLSSRPSRSHPGGTCFAFLDAQGHHQNAVTGGAPIEGGATMPAVGACSASEARTDRLPIDLSRWTGSRFGTLKGMRG